MYLLETWCFVTSVLQKSDKVVSLKYMNVEKLIFDQIKQLSSKSNRVCFTPKSFIHLASYDAVKKALERLVKSKKVRRVTRGIYDLPYESKLTGKAMSPDIEQVVRAIAERDKIKIQPTGAQAANLLGLSEQVPARVVYLTDGRRKEVKVGDTEVVFQPVSNKDMSLSGSLFGLIVQAMKHLGKENITEDIIKRINRLIKDNPDESISDKMGSAPIWIAELLKKNISEL